MNERGTTLTGIDGSNPLGFMAALGLLRILDEQAPQLARMRWVFDGVWSPQLVGQVKLPRLARLIRNDLASWKDAHAFSMAYDENGERRKRGEKYQVTGKDGHPALDKKGKPKMKTADNEVKASPSLMRIFMDEVVIRAQEDRREADWFAAVVSDVVTDNNGKCKPTALHFYAGQQRFLGAANETRKKLAALDEESFESRVEETLRGPWLRNSPMKSFSWDSAVQRVYALRADDPSGSKEVCVPVAEWLALRGLASFPSFPRGEKLLSSSIDGDWSKGAFFAVLWSCWASSRTATSLQQSFVPPGRGRSSLTLAERDARGICAVWRCCFERTGQGSGRFLPAEPA